MFQRRFIVPTTLISLLSVSAATTSAAVITFHSSDFSSGWELRDYTRSVDGETISIQASVSGGGLTFDASNFTTRPGDVLVDSYAGFIMLSDDLTFNPASTGTVSRITITVESDYRGRERNFFQEAPFVPLFVVEHAGNLHVYEFRGAINNTHNDFDFEANTFTHSATRFEFPFGRNQTLTQEVTDGSGTWISRLSERDPNRLPFTDEMRFGFGSWFNGPSWGTASSITVDVEFEPIPEPGTAGLLALGTPGLLRRRRR